MSTVTPVTAPAAPAAVTTLTPSANGESSAGGRSAPAATYLLPIKADRPPADELTHYLRAVSGRCEVIVVDGSAPRQFEAAHREWSSFALHVAPHADVSCLNGKVRGVVTGLRLSTAERVVIADDDVRYDMEALDRVIAELDLADVVVPQNYFDPLPWHARWDTARTLLNRATGGDFPGTLAVRSALLRDGYDGDVLFENLELIRTVEARGGTCRRTPDLYVRRLPPSTRHFLGQRVRQAYDELARPSRCMFWSTLLPATLLISRWRGRIAAYVALSVISIAAAESGRRRCGGRRRFPFSATLFAPLWVAERAVCMWLALGLRIDGGVRYNGRRIVRAATPVRRLRGEPRVPPSALRLRDPEVQPVTLGRTVQSERLRRRSAGALARRWM